MHDIFHLNITQDSEILGKISDFFEGKPVEFIHCDPQPDAIPMHCYWNVERVVQRSGGRIIFGWMLYHAEHILVGCWHHAVWQSPNGKVIDVSPPHPDINSSKYTPFVRDTIQSYDLTRPPAIPQKSIRLCDHEIVSKFINLYQKLQIIKRNYLEEQLSVPGATLDITSWRFNGNQPALDALKVLEAERMEEITHLEDQLVHCRYAVAMLQASITERRGPQNGPISNHRS